MRRRDLLALGLAGALAACDRRRRGVASDVAGLPARLRALDAAVAANGCAIRLAPGRAEADVVAAGREAGVRLPRELVALWAWHDGQDRHDPGFLFRDQHLLSCADALDQLELAALLAGRDDHYLLPFAAFEGSVYALPAEPWTFDRRFERPVIGVGEGVQVFFHSLGHLVDTQLAWLADGRCADRRYGLDRARELGPWRRINPGLF